MDPEHGPCANLAAMALRRLGRPKEAKRILDATLGRRPDDATTHTNLGWSLLQAGDHKGAREHFRDALRLDPTSDWARQGMVQALKARNLIFRLLLGYFFWMARLSSQARWGVILGGYIGYRVLRSVAQNNESLRVVIYPLLIAYGLFVLLTWIGDSLFNLLLRLDRYGRHALSDEQIRAANLVGLCLLAAVVMGGIFFAGFPHVLLPAVALALLAVPVSATHGAIEPRSRKILGACTIAIALAALSGAGMGLAGLEAAAALAGVAILGCFLFTWLANLLP